MAKRAANGKSLVIVESPAKARTISKYLGRNFTVEASIGHIRDLPEGAKEVPEQFKGQPWARLGVNVDDNFTPIYIVPSEKRSQVSKLKQLLKGAGQLYLATDEDREGEAISWHLCEVLKPKVPVRRLVFHEITKEAIQEALENPRDIDEGLVRAQETRRILDRLYGYEVSPLLWKKVKPKLSAGRVQSVAVKMIVEREKQRIAFRAATWWDLVGRFHTAISKEFEATLVSLDGRKVPSGKDFDPATGRIKDEQLLLLDEQAARDLAQRLMSEHFRITNVEERPYTRKPADPFTTSTLQQEANRKLGFGARRTMDVAQSLYENGHITYMRTDSTNLAQVAIDAARDLVRAEYGAEYLPAEPRVYRSKVKNAQEAHEAIRPAGHPFELPAVLKGELNYDQFRLFELIWKRTIASQMVDARGRIMTVTLEADGAVFQVSGRSIEFPGFLRAYVEGSDDPEAEIADQERILPSVAVGDSLACLALTAKDHTTQPPARFTEASLTGALEDRGIGRPSTYASIIETILARQYVFKKGSALVPTWTAFSVARLLEEHLPRLVDYQFTAQMEDLLDAISRQEEEPAKYLSDFYFGNGQPGLKQQLESKLSEIDARDLARFPLGKPQAGEHREDVFVRVGKYGPFIEQGERKASIPEDLPPDELNLAKAIEMLEQASVSQEPLGICPDTHKPVYLKQGRFGPYVQRGVPDDEDKKNASLLANMKPADVTFELALKLLTIPRTLGEHPQSHEPIVAYNGKFGPYIKCGTETRSLPRELSPLDATLEQAVELLAQPKARGRGRAAPREPLKTFEAPSPVTGQPVKVLEGRFGVYVSDGTTNATLPRGMAVDQLTFDEALNLLGERAARGPSTRRRRGRGGKPSAAPKAARAARPAANSKGKDKPAKLSKPAKSAKPKKAAKRSGRSRSEES
ncbi:MAG: type I DNA topoisomerase [Planctomycetaceae bacterium]|nr:type I DNA topoisomerase [Planctomycetaceae bacterium]